MSSASTIIKILQTAIKKVDWKQVLIVVGPVVWDPLKEKIKKLIEGIGEPGKKIEERIADIEKRQIEQARISEQLTDQLSTMSDLVGTVSARVIIFGIIAVLAFIISLVVLVLQLT